MPKNVQTTTHLHSFHMQQGNAQNPSVRLQQYVNRELPNVKVGLKKGRGLASKGRKGYQIAHLH